MSPTTLSLRAHAFVFASIRAATIGVSFLTTIFLVRMLRISDYGYFAAATGIFNLTFAFGYFGLDQLYLSGKMNAAELQRRLCQLAGLVSLGSAVIAVLWPALAAPERLLVLLLGLAGAMEIFRGAWLLTPQKAGNYPARAWRELGGKLAVLLGSCIGAGLLHTGIAAGGGALVTSALLTGALLVTRRLAIRTAMPLHSLRLWSRLRAGLPYGVSNVLFTIYFSADMALLGSLAAPEQAAYYRVAYGFVGAAVSIALAVNNEVYRPQIYGMPTSAIAKRDVRRVSRLFFWLNLFLGISACLAVALPGSALLVPIFGDAYGPARPLLQILAIALPFHYLNSWAGNGLVASGRLRKVLLVQSVTAGVNVAGNLLLIPAMGARGSALVTVGSEIICSAAYVLVLSRARSVTPDASART